MPIQRSFEIDIESSEVCDFLTNHEAKEYDRGLGKEDTIHLADYVDTQKRKSLLDPVAQSITLYTCARRKYEIEEIPDKNNQPGMQVGFAETYTRIDHKVSLSIYAILLIKKTLKKDKITLIKDAFDRYQPAANPAVDKVDLAEQMLMQQGVNVSDYQVLLSFKLVLARKQA